MPAAKNPTPERQAEIEARRKERSEAIKNETKAQAFTRLGVNRTINVLNALSVLQGLSAKENYDYTQEQWDKIFSAVDAKVAEVKASVAAGGKQKAAGFGL